MRHYRIHFMNGMTANFMSAADISMIYNKLMGTSNAFADFGTIVVRKDMVVYVEKIQPQDKVI